MAEITIQNLDERVRRRLRSRANRHGRSMEDEIRAILEEAVKEPAEPVEEESGDLATAILERFGALGGVELDLPPRSEPPRAPDFSSPDFDP